MGVRNRQRNSFVVALLLAGAVAVQAARADEPQRQPDGGTRLEVRAATHIAVGPLPDLPVYRYPVGVEAGLALASFPRLRRDPAREEIVRTSAGWGVRTGLVYLHASPVVPTFGDLRLLMPVVEAGPTLLLSHALGQGAVLGLSAGGGYYLAWYDFADETLRASRPFARVAASATAILGRLSLGVDVGFLDLLDESTRRFVSVSLGGAFAVATAGGLDAR